MNSVVWSHWQVFTRVEQTYGPFWAEEVLRRAEQSAWRQILGQGGQAA